jgi:arylsulfatase A-like enzyme
MVNVALFADFNVLATARNIPDAQETIDVTNSVAVASAEIDAAPADNSAVVAVAAVPLRDFGDAPFSATYHTLKVHDGARHRLVGPYFGGSPPGHAHRDADPDGMPSPNADGDNVGDGNNDEAGVRVLDPLIPGSTTVGVEINAPLGGRVDAWIDFDGNHSWADPGEQIFTSLAVPAGVSVHVISVPAGATPGDTHARFRISTAGGLSDYGYAPDGEDEDYKVTVTFPPIVAFADAAHTALGNAHLSLSANGLAISNLGSNGQDGVSIDLQELSRRATLSFGPAGFTLPGLGKLSFAAHGMVNDVPERSLGLVRFEEHNGTVNGFWCCAGDWFLQAPRLEVYNGATLVGVYAVSQDGFLGTLSGDGRLTDVSFVAERGHDAFWCYDGWWWFTPPGQPSVNLVVTQLRLVYVGSADQIENLARLDVTGSNIDTLLIQEENAPRFQPRLRLERAAPGINLKWDTRSAVLQSAPSVEGPWTNVREGTNATPTSATNANEFFRLQARPVELATPCFPFPGYVCKRNILVLVADDVGIDQIPVYVNYYAGTSHPITVTTTANPITTPTIDKLASAGVTFLNAWSCPTCSPTRAGLLTGLYSFRHGVYSPTVPDLPSDAKTIAQVLKDSGYATGMFGKWHLGSSTDYRPLEFGFDRYAGCLEGELTTSYYSWGKSDYALTALGGIAVPSGGTNITTTYATHQNVSDATNWIAGRTTPWMAAVTFNAGHWAKNGAGDRHYEMPPTGCPYAARTDDGGLNDFRSMIECMDRSIADLLSGIDSNVLEQTTIIFMGDNGTEGRVTGVNVAGTIKTVTIGEHFTSLSGVTGNHSKGSLYEGGIYVPLIIADGYSYVHPQQQSSWTKGLGRVASPGRFETAVVQTTDLFASMAKIGRGDASCGVDSVSLLPYLSSSAAAPQRDVIFAETYSGGQWDVAVRGESYKLIIRNYCVSPTYELYHLTSDPWETTELLSAAPAWALNGLIRNILNTRLDSLLSVPAACTITPVFPVPTVPCP